MFLELEYQKYNFHWFSNVGRFNYFYSILFMAIVEYFDQYFSYVNATDASFPYIS